MGQTSYSTDRLTLLGNVRAVLTEYEGTLITKRQLYYRLVANGCIPNSHRSYKRIVEATAQWSKEGEIPLSAFEDRTRGLNRFDQGWREDDPDIWLYSAISEAVEVSESYHLAAWFGQDRRVVVGVEKQALEGVFVDICSDLNVDLAVFRGYSSLSFLKEISDSIDDDDNDGRDVVLLYFGDFDPSGLNIPEAAEETLNGFFGRNIEFRRIALSLEQARSLKLIPAPVKQTDSRTDSFVSEHGTQVFELDAVEPRMLQEMIRDAVAKHIDRGVTEQRNKLVAKGRRKIKNTMTKSGIYELLAKLKPDGVD